MLDIEMRAKLLIPDRPWENEPDFEEWVDKKTNYRCRVERNKSMLHLCGYVAVPIGNKLRDMDYNRAMEVGVHPHGGLTFSGVMNRRKWFGFDCAHTGDLVPLAYMTDVVENGEPFGVEIYRTFEWVKEETTKLAHELAQIHEDILTQDILSATKESLLSGTSLTQELAKRGYVHKKKKGANKC